MPGLADRGRLAPSPGADLIRFRLLGRKLPVRQGVAAARTVLA